MSTSAEMDLYVRNMFRNLYFIKEESTTHFMWLIINSTIYMHLILLQVLLGHSSRINPIIKFVSLLECYTEQLTQR